MPLIPLVLGSLALAGAGFLYNKVDDAFIDPLSGETDRPLVSDRVVLIAVIAVALTIGIAVAKRKL